MDEQRTSDLHASCHLLYERSHVCSSDGNVSVQRLAARIHGSTMTTTGPIDRRLDRGY